MAEDASLRDEHLGTGPGGLAPARSPGSEHAPAADEAMVRALLRAQCPELADQPLVPGPTGWDNIHWLVGGTRLAARLPRRDLAVPLIANEVRTLGEVADRLPVAVPAPVHVGEPGEGWPWPWTVVPWFDAERADLAYPPVPAEQHGATLGAVLAALHQPAALDVPVSAWRGVPLEARAERFARARSEVAGGGRIEPELLALADAVFAAGLEAPPHPGDGTWIHGDLHPGNQLVADRELHAVVDWGDSGRGDPASDLATAWWTLPPVGHASLRDAYEGVDDATWARAAAWAAAIAVQLLRDGPATGDHAIIAMAHRTLQRLAETHGPG